MLIMRQAKSIVRGGAAASVPRKKERLAVPVGLRQEYVSSQNKVLVGKEKKKELLEAKAEGEKGHGKLNCDTYHRTETFEAREPERGEGGSWGDNEGRG